MTPAITERPGEFQIACLNAVRSYDAFSADTDPRGMHEMGVLEIQGEIVWFKIDLLDERYEHASPDPADTEKTRRVLTIQFPEER